jgi:hypothetical protein
MPHTLINTKRMLFNGLNKPNQGSFLAALHFVLVISRPTEPKQGTKIMLLVHTKWLRFGGLMIVLDH